MKVIKVKYIPVDASAEKTIELLDVTRITENFLNETLFIEIDDVAKRNSGDVFAEMVKSTIVSIIIEDQNGAKVNEITNYIKMRNLTRSFYNVNTENDDNPNNDSLLRLTFTKSVEVN